MGTLQIIALVAGILGAQVVLWFFVARWIRRRTAALSEEVRANVTSAGETIRRGPEPAVYRGGTGEFPFAKGNGVMVLTDRRLVFAKLVGRGLEIPVADLVGASESTWFRGSATGGQRHLVLETRAGDKVGFFVADRDAWADALKLPRPSAGARTGVA